ncbi:MAG: hypothetical protein JW760_00160 [Spirochaetales bacterium]|nr:hypothetical protein [Spirochaetales bacterium]
MKRCHGVLIILLVFVLGLFSSCDLLPGFITGEERGFVVLKFSLQGENTTGVYSVTMDLTGDDSKRRFSEDYRLEAPGNSIYGFLPDVPVGSWNVKISLFNSGGTSILEDTLGSSFSVYPDEITTLTVTYDPALGADLTIQWESSSTVESAVSIDRDSFGGCYALFAEGDNNYQVREVNYLSGRGAFQAASSFSFLYPDGSSFGYSTRSIYADFSARTDDTSFTAFRQGGGSGTYTVRVTDIYDIPVSAQWQFPYTDASRGLTYGTNPQQGGSISASGDNTLTWDPVDDGMVKSIVVLIVEKAWMDSGPPAFYPASALDGWETGIFLPGSTLSSGTEYVMILLTFDKWVSDTTPFGSITNFYPMSLIDTILSYPEYDMDFIGISYTTFGTTS